MIKEKTNFLSFTNKDGFNWQQQIRNFKYKGLIFYYSISKDVYFFLAKDGSLIINNDMDLICSFSDSKIVRSFIIKKTRFDGIAFADFVKYLSENRLLDLSSNDNNCGTLFNVLGNGKDLSYGYTYTK